VVAGACVEDCVTLARILLLFKCTMNYMLPLMVNNYDLNKTERVGDWLIGGENYEISANYEFCYAVI